MFEVVGLNSSIFPLQSNSHLEKARTFQLNDFWKSGKFQKPNGTIYIYGPRKKKDPKNGWGILQVGNFSSKKGDPAFSQMPFFRIFRMYLFFLGGVGWKWRPGRDRHVFFRPTCGVWLLLQFESWSLTENTKTPSLTTASLHLKIGKLPNGKLGRIPSINFQGNSVDGRIPKQPPDIL